MQVLKAQGSAIDQARAVAAIMAQLMDNNDLAMLKEYVTAPGNFGANQADTTVLLHVTHSNLKAEFMEIRLDKHVRVDSLDAFRCR